MSRCWILLLLLCLTGMLGLLDASSIQINWTAPTTNEDGSPLTDLAGYKLYYGTSSGNYSTILDAGLSTQVVISGLVEGTEYFFAATALDTSQNESEYSVEVPYTIPTPPSDMTPPTVAITSPDMGASVPRRSTVSVIAEATDDLGIVDHVTLFVDGQQICADGTAPYSCLWRVPAPKKRRYQLQAEAVDPAGNRGSSAVVEVSAQ